MGKTLAARSRFAVGDWVRIPFSGRRVEALIVEDRGRIGSGRQRLYTVRVPTDPAESAILEFPEADLEAADSNIEIDVTKAADYLKRGGLIAVLRSNLSGGNAPRVWLRYDTRGDVTHTFIEEFGLVGGEPAPFFALHGKHIFAPKVDEVRAFLRSLGFTDRAVRSIVEAVGTAP